MRVTWRWRSIRRRAGESPLTSVLTTLASGTTLTFSGSSFNLTFANSLGSINVPGTVAGFDGATNGLGDLVFNWDKNPATPYGDNYMLFDNVNVTTAVPEPSAALLTGLATLVLFRRRR